MPLKVKVLKKRGLPYPTIVAIYDFLKKKKIYAYTADELANELHRPVSTVRSALRKLVSSKKIKFSIVDGKKYYYYVKK